jgi:hypothetical protein
MGLDLFSTYAPGIFESLLTWRGVAGLVAAVSLGYLIISWLPGQKSRPKLLDLKTGGIEFEKVAAIYDDYDKSYGVATSNRA